MFNLQYHKYYKLGLCQNYMADTILQTAEDLQIVPLTKQLALHQAESILALEHNWTEIGDEPWNLENLIYELPGKWELSHIALNHEDIVGYQIGSIREGHAFLNKIIVDREKRVKSAGRGLLRAFLNKSLEKGLARVRFRVRVDNPAVGFYEKLGFVPKGELDYSRKDGVASYFYDTRIMDVIQRV